MQSTGRVALALWRPSVAVNRSVGSAGRRSARLPLAGSSASLDLDSAEARRRFSQLAALSSHQWLIADRSSIGSAAASTATGFVARRRHFAEGAPRQPENKQKTDSQSSRPDEASSSGEQTDNTSIDADSQEGSGIKGQAVTLLGMAGLGLSMVLKNPMAARALRVAGPGGMILGVVISVYELGGWTLLLGIPASIVGLWTASHFSGRHYDSVLKTQVANEIREACSDLPQEALLTLDATAVREYETNKARLEVQWSTNASSGTQWHIEVCGVRSSSFHPWQVTSVKVSHGIRQERPSNMPAPQTRSWDDQRGLMQWRLVWERK